MTLFALSVLFLLSVTRKVNGVSAVPSEDFSSARRGAFAYLLNNRDSQTYGWPDGQTPALILGLLSANPTWLTFGTGSSDYSALLTKNRLEIEALSAIAKDPNLKDMDSANFALMAGALQVACFPLSDFHGKNLVSMAIRRLDSTPHTSPSFASIVLILCNEGKEIPASVVAKLNGNFKPGSLCPFCVETAGVNIQALVCIEKLFLSGPKKPLPENLITWLKVENRRFIDSMQDKETGSFGSLVATSLALQAQHLTWKGDRFNRNKALRFLLSYRRKDGSFSNSLLFTALAIPAISSNTGVTGGVRLLCPHLFQNSTKKDQITISYKVEDMVYTKQSLRGSFTTKRGYNLYEALRDYSDRHVDVFNLEVTVSSLGVQVKAVNNLKNDLTTRTFWRTSIEYKNGSKKKELLLKGLDKVTPVEDVIYVLTFLRL